MRLNASDPGFYFSSLYFRLPEETEVAAFDDESASVIRLNNSTVLYMREINKVLALVCILREENFTKPGKYLLILYQTELWKYQVLLTY